MFKTTVKQVIPIPKRDFCLFTGDSPITGLKTGTCVTDGVNEYEVMTIPFVHYKSSDCKEPTDFVLKPGNYDPNELIGKMLYAV